MESQIAQAAGVTPRPVVRCDQCDLVQFLTMSRFCRKCGAPIKFLDEKQDPIQPEIATAPGIRQIRRGSSPLSISSKPGCLVGKSVFRLRELTGMTQGDLGKAISVPRTYISRIECGRLVPGTTISGNIAHCFNVPLWALIYGPFESEIAWLLRNGTASEIASIADKARIMAESNVEVSQKIQIFELD